MVNMRLRRIPEDQKKKASAAATAATTTPLPQSPEAPSKNSNGWTPLRSARNVTAAVQRRLDDTLAANANANATKAEAAVINDTSSPSPTGSSTGTGNLTQEQSQSIAAYSDNFTFAPMPNFVPISSCDVDPPNFDTPTDLKISSNFTKLITNAKKVDKVRAQAKRAAAPPINPNATVEEMTKEFENISIEEAQKRLIDQLKQGLNFLTRENKELTHQRNDLEEVVASERCVYTETLQTKQKEVEERNLKLAVLEHHFRILNDHSGTEDGPLEAQAGGSPVAVSANGTDGEGDGNDNSESKPVTINVPVTPTASSSIIQIDKGYFMELEATLKQEKSWRNKTEKVNEDLAMKYAILERDTCKKGNEMTEQVTRQERTIQSLEQSLKLMREARFKKAKKATQHRRRATVSAIDIPSNVNTIPAAEEEDENSVSCGAASLNSSPNDLEQEQELEEQQDSKEAAEEAIAAAVADALEKQEKEHASTMDYLSKQLDIKEKIINRLETKMFSLVKSNKENMATPQRAIPQDVMIRSIAVTNELMDTSMRKLENMIGHIERVEKENRTEIVDELAPVRRVATKISLVHEEMKVSMKLIEQRIQNGAEVARQQSQKKSGGENSINGDVEEVDEAGQTSGEDGKVSTPQPSIEDLIGNVTKALKETESSVKEEIGKVKDHLETIEFELAAKTDTIEALELACAEHVENYRSLQKDYEDHKFEVETPLE
jgi:hypothetical protein